MCGTVYRLCDIYRKKLLRIIMASLFIDGASVASLKIKLWPAALELVETTGLVFIFIFSLWSHNHTFSW